MLTIEWEELQNILQSIGKAFKGKFLHFFFQQVGKLLLRLLRKLLGLIHILVILPLANMWWATNYQPNVDAYRATAVSALNAYNADPTDANWANVVTAFVDGWAVQYNAANG